jgi:hypothetical protein
MPKHDIDPELKRDLENRIQTIENLDDSELGSFKALDWWILIIVSLVIPIIVVEIAR